MSTRSVASQNTLLDYDGRVARAFVWVGARCYGLNPAAVALYYLALICKRRDEAYEPASQKKKARPTLRGLG